MAADGSSVRAGSYAEARYQRTLSYWRRRSRLVVWAFVGPFIVAGVVGLAIDWHAIAWAAGVVFGLGVGVLITLRESPPAYIENWRLGAEGERKTEKALQSLDRSRWFVLHDVANARGNYDHILAGPAGVFMLETKNPQGAVYMRDGQPRLRRVSDPEADTACSAMRSGALARAANLKEDIQQRTSRRMWVQAVVVLWSDFGEGIYEDDRCVFVQGKRLSGWLEARPQTLARSVIEDVTGSLQRMAAEASCG